MNDFNEVLQTVRDVVSHQLKPAKIVDLNVESDFDHDGDPILRITIVFESEDDSLPTKRVLGLARHLREPLEAIGESIFPVFSFMTPEEREGEAA